MHKQIDVGRFSAWVGVDRGFVIGAKIVLTMPETETSFGGQSLSFWIGSLYLGVSFAPKVCI